MTRKEYNEITHLMKHGALQGIDTGRLDGKCENVIPLEDAIAIIDSVYKTESEDTINIAKDFSEWLEDIAEKYCWDKNDVKAFIKRVLI